MQAVLEYKLLELFSMPTAGKVLAILAVTIPLTLIGGECYRRAAGVTMEDALWKAYNVLSDTPGADIIAEKNWRATVVTHTIFLAGTFTFAVLLGILTDDISSAVLRVRTGNYPLVEDRHTVVLGWNKQLMPVLRQISYARAMSSGDVFGQPVVVLADRDKEEMDALVRDDLKGFHGAVITRHGKPSQLADLVRVSADTAKTVIVLHPDCDDEATASAQKAATLAALRAAGGVRGQSLVVQASGADDAVTDRYNAAAAAVAQLRAAGAPQIVTLSNTDCLGKLMSNVALQPGLETVFADLLQYEDVGVAGAEMYIAASQHAAGSSFRDVRRGYRSASVCGYIDAASGTLHMNPPDDAQLSPGDRLVLVADSVAKITHRTKPPAPDSTPAAVETARAAVVTALANSPRQRVVVLSFDGDQDGLVQDLRHGSHHDTRVTVVCESSAGGGTGAAEGARRKLLPRRRWPSLLRGHPASQATLSQLKWQEVDTVVIAGLSGRQADSADAQVVASIIQLQQLLRQLPARRTPLRVVACISHPSTRQVVEDMTGSQLGEAPLLITHLLNPDELLSGILAQVASEPELNLVYNGLLSSSSGCELRLRPAAHYDLGSSSSTEVADEAAKIYPDLDKTWDAVAERVRDAGDTAIGILSVNGKLAMAPDADQPAKLLETDQLVVLAHTG